MLSKLLFPVYRVYEWLLWRQIRGGPMPRHVAIIPDGNRRWARIRGLESRMGHRHGYEKLKEVLNWLWDLGVETITIYAMSSENCLYRSPEERRHLFDLAKKGFKELREDPKIKERGIRVKVIGKLDLVPRDVLEEAGRVETETASNKGPLLLIALCYGGRQEIVDAVRRIALDVARGRLRPGEIDEATISRYLYTSGAPDPDLIIRTSGEERISNFLLWQSAYSELYFCDTYWPEFRRIDLWRAIRSYQKRERRFGR